MPFAISSAALAQIIASASFKTDGDANERQNWPLLHERFAACENFWREFVVPLTKRIELPPEAIGRIEERESVAEDLWRIAFQNHSILVHFGYANWHLTLTAPSSFGDFYTHLGSICDLAEDFLVGVYLLTNECRGEKVPVLQELSREEFRERADNWYDRYYPNVFENYHSKGKPGRLILPPRVDLLSEYLGDDPSWRQYKSFSNSLRQYRNVVVHDVLMGHIQASDGTLFAPKREKIQTYRRFFEVRKAARDDATIRRDFVEVKQQMIADFAGLQIALNDLWRRPHNDFRDLMSKRNLKLLARYNLQIT